MRIIIEITWKLHERKNTKYIMFNSNNNFLALFDDYDGNKIENVILRMNIFGYNIKSN